LIELAPVLTWEPVQSKAWEAVQFLVLEPVQSNGWEPVQFLIIAVLRT
jgi:hypothetical protein